MSKRKHNKRWTDDMPEEKISLVEFGVMKGQMAEVHEIITSGKGCACGISNKINIRWVWSAVCLLAFGCGSGFSYLFHLIQTGK